MARILRASLPVLALLTLMLSAVSAAAQPEMLCPGEVVPLDVSAAYSPFTMMRLGGREGYFQIDTGSTYSTIDTRIFGRALGASVMLADSSFPTIAGGKFRVLDFATMTAPGRGQAGQIGTDFLSQRTVEFHYEAARPYLVISERPCRSDALEAAGFVAIGQRGYFGADASHRLPQMDNLPVAFIRIGGVAAPVWIDSGYKEFDRAGVIQINERLLQKLRAAGVALQRAGAASFSNCRGERFDTRLWRVMEAPLIFTTETGRPLFANDPPILEVVPHNSCGGPGDTPMAIGRIGAAYLHWWGTLVLDPFNERVWISPRRAKPPQRYRAMALAWNRDGAWAVEFAATLARARSQALSVCNEKYGRCTLTTAEIAPVDFSCLAVARSAWNRSKLSFSMRGSLEEVRGNVLDHCARINGGSCEIAYSACND